MAAGEVGVHCPPWGCGPSVPHQLLSALPPAPLWQCHLTGVPSLQGPLPGPRAPLGPKAHICRTPGAQCLCAGSEPGRWGRTDNAFPYAHR